MPAAIAERTTSLVLERPQGRTLHVVPIMGPSRDRPDYRLLDRNTFELVRVTEIGEAGTVPELIVENTIESRVFLMDGQELLGAKQNRILNADVLVPPQSKITIPVSCVEEHRWNRTSVVFSPGKSASFAVRSGKLSRVHSSLKLNTSFCADQSAVWNEVSSSLTAAGATSPTKALHDAYQRRAETLDAFRSQLKMPPDAVGLAVFHGDRLLGLDVFDRTSTLRAFWDMLVDSYAVDWLLVDPTEQDVTAPDPDMESIREVLQWAADGKWESYQSPGEGIDYRLDDEEYAGAALVWHEESVLHLQIFPKSRNGAK